MRNLTINVTLCNCFILFHLWSSKTLINAAISKGITWTLLNVGRNIECYYFWLWFTLFFTSICCCNLHFHLLNFVFLLKYFIIKACLCFLICLCKLDNDFLVFFYLLILYSILLFYRTKFFTYFLDFRLQFINLFLCFHHLLSQKIIIMETLIHKLI